jgi:hypothetical protein
MVFSAPRRDGVERMVIVSVLLVSLRVARECGTVAAVREASRIPCAPRRAAAAAVRGANVTRLLQQGKPARRARAARGACAIRGTPLFS